MRQLLLASAAVMIAGVAHAADAVTFYSAAPGQAALALPEFQSSLPGARLLKLSVGVGSSAFRDPSAPANTFFTLGDRGANFTCEEGEGYFGIDAKVACPAADGLKAGAGRLYPEPDFVISIYEVTLDPAARTFTVSKVIPLTTPKGAKITGVTNPLTVATTEVPRDGNGNVIPQNANAIDAEGLVRLPDGRFFIAEENATGIVEVSADGVIQRRFVPAGTEKDFAAADYPVTGSLPAILARRHSNRGMESLALSEDGKFLFSLVQNPLDNPDSKAYGKAVNTRLVKLELGKDASGATTLTPVAEYVYELDNFEAFTALGATDAEQPSSLRISEMTSLGGDRFLVDERTDQVAKIFEIDLNDATNILGSKWDDAATVPTLEQAAGAKAVGVTPVKKTERLVASSLEGASPRFPAKIEGMAITADGKLMLINDNDFGIGGADTVIAIVDTLTQ
ncbi:MAG: esterase-like activity of phytase family protein [Rhizobiales bacterium]|nr:esterase-like activity of phytase family protein [Hyphomicrobiales bacterium]